MKILVLISSIIFYTNISFAAVPDPDWIASPLHNADNISNKSPSEKIVKDMLGNFHSCDEVDPIVIGHGDPSPIRNECSKCSNRQVIKDWNGSARLCILKDCGPNKFHDGSGRCYDCNSSITPSVDSKYNNYKQAAEECLVCGRIISKIPKHWGDRCVLPCPANQSHNKDGECVFLNK